MPSSGPGFLSLIPVVAALLTASISASSAADNGLIKVGDATIEYFSQGQGDAVVLLPGGSLTVNYLQGLANALADAGYRAVRINFRGAGKSTGPANGVTLHTLAADVAGVIEALKLGPANVAGHAFGNRVARTLDADRPDIVHSVILLGAGGKIEPKPPAARAMQTIFDPAASQADILAAMQYAVGNPQEVEPAWKIVGPCRAPLAAGMQNEAMKTTPLEDWWAPASTTRYLILQGTNDQIAPPENGELLKQELGARATLVAVPGAGHLMLVTEPKKTADAIVAYLR